MFEKIRKMKNKKGFTLVELIVVLVILAILAALGDVVFYGKGAGKLPTASAVVADVIDALKEGVKVHDSLFWKPAEKPEGLLEDRNTYPWYLRVTGVAAVLLPSVAGAGHVVFEDNGEAAYLVDAATSADIAAVTEKIEVLGGKVALAMKKLED
jgi:homoserine dehydrogenase